MGKYYVTMTDKFMSGWGRAENKKAKFVYECDSKEEAQVVKDNAIARGDQKDVMIAKEKPVYSKTGHHVEWKNKENSSNWYKEGFFKN